MNKLNKKGFTLIEMLVVIAVIAVLVSIVIPTVTSATDKAAAATNAANMRSWKAELTTSYLANGKEGFTCTWADEAEVTATPTTAPAVKLMDGVAKDASGNMPVMKAYYDKDTNSFTIKIGTFTIDSFADFAGGEDDTLAAPPTGKIAD